MFVGQLMFVGIADVCVCGIADVCRIACMEHGRDYRTSSSKHAKKHWKIFKKLPPEPPKWRPGASKIQPGALQDAKFKRCLT